jgi:hypothetical protein
MGVKTESELGSQISEFAFPLSGIRASQNLEASVRSRDEFSPRDGFATSLKPD